jgi:hypothetical protein
MRDCSRNRLLARSGVLLIAVLHLAGVGLTAPGHGNGSGERRMALAEEDAGGPDVPRQHDAEHCATCHLGAALALPELPGARLPRPVPGATTGNDHPAPVLPGPPLRTTARAPPAA